MSVNPVRDLANIRYTGYYLPIASWFIIYLQTRSEIHFTALIFAFAGALVVHGIFRAIFGDEGPRRNPKKRLVVAGYILALLFQKRPGGNPDSTEEFQERFAEAFTIRRCIRFAVLSVIVFGYVISIPFSLILLFDIATTNPPNLIAAGLLLGQTVFVTQGKIHDLFASNVPTESAEWIYVPEYRRVVEENTTEGELNEDFEHQDYPGILDDIRQIAFKFMSRQENNAQQESPSSGDN